MLTGDGLNDLFEFNPSTLEWKKLASMTEPVRRGGHGFESVDGWIYVFGGDYYSENIGNGKLAQFLSLWPDCQVVDCFGSLVTLFAPVHCRRMLILFVSM